MLLKYQNVLLEWGVVATEFIPKGMFVAEYRGKIVSKDQAEVLEKKYKEEEKGNYIYNFQYNGDQW